MLVMLLQSRLPGALSNAQGLSRSAQGLSPSALLSWQTLLSHALCFPYPSQLRPPAAAFAGAVRQGLLLSALLHLHQQAELLMTYPQALLLSLKLPSASRLLMSPQALHSHRACPLDMHSHRALPQRAAAGRKWLLQLLLSKALQASRVKGYLTCLQASGLQASLAAASFPAKATAAARILLLPCQ